MNILIITDLVRDVKFGSRDQSADRHIWPFGRIIVLSLTRRYGNAIEDDASPVDGDNVERAQKDSPCRRSSTL